jgi:hypothetical protein
MHKWFTLPVKYKNRYFKGDEMKKSGIALLLVTSGIFGAASEVPGKIPKLVSNAFNKDRYACSINHWKGYSDGRTPGFIAAIMERTDLRLSEQGYPLGMCRALAVKIAYAANDNGGYNIDDLPDVLYQVMAETDEIYASGKMEKRDCAAIKKVAVLFGKQCEEFDEDNPPFSSHKAWRVVVGYGEKQDDQANFLPQLTDILELTEVSLPFRLKLLSSEDGAPEVLWGATK